MPIWVALLYFGIPAVVVIFIVYVVMPLLAARGVHIFFNYLMVYATVPMLALIAASLIAYRREGNVMSWVEFKNRFRLKSMDGKSWLWTIGLALFMVFSAGLLSFTAHWLASISFFAPPDYWPAELKPHAQGDLASGALPTDFMGVPLAGNWWILPVLVTSLMIATFGEELWWRGYILPRQELAHGNRAWLIHGLLWTAFHGFAPWNLLTILPGCLALSYVAQRLENTWPAIIAHGLANGLLVIIVVVLGITG
ncbi:MAG TPA: CPBP family intramembrane glutamic endopeptidase [Xanthomonadales bacterium]|nr:CPBP family intramembrane glutamic endopeptidase [Xanthomonadales bacterium]